VKRLERAVYAHRNGCERGAGIINRLDDILMEPEKTVIALIAFLIKTNDVSVVVHPGHCRTYRIGDLEPYELAVYELVVGQLGTCKL
jgi:hypothetical protein